MSNSDSPFKYYGLYGWYKDKIIDRNKNSDTKEHKYLHNFDIIAFNHLKNNWGVSHYNNIDNLKFVAYDSKSLDDDNIFVQNLIYQKYIKNYTSKIPDTIPWVDIVEARYAQYRGYSKNFSESITNDNASYAKDKIISMERENIPPSLTKKYQEIFNDIEKYLQEKYNKNQLSENELEIFKAAKRTCKNFAAVEGILSTKFPSDVHNFNKQLYIGTVEKILTLDKTDNKIISPFYIPKKLADMHIFAWSVFVNKAMFYCFLNSSTSIAPIYIIIDNTPNSIMYKSAISDINNGTLKYIGFFIVRYSEKIDNPESIFNKMNKEDKKKYMYKSHETVAPYYILFIYKRHDIKYCVTSVYNMFSIVNFKGNYVQWGDLTDNKRFLYYELRQLMCMQAKNDISLYALLNKSTEKTKYIPRNNNITSWWKSSNDYKGTTGYTNENELHLICCKPSTDYRSLKLMYENYELLEVSLIFNDVYLTDEKTAGEVYICNKKNNKIKYNENDLCIKDDYIDLIYKRDMKTFSHYHEGGGNNNNDVNVVYEKYLNNLNELKTINPKLIEKYYKDNGYFLQNLSIEESLNSLKRVPRIFNIQNNTIYFNGNKLVDTKFIFPVSQYLIPRIPKNISNISNVLIVSVNGQFAEAILKIYPACNVDLYLINISNLGGYIKFKEKYPNTKIIIGNMELTNDIFKYINKKYDSIIIDMGYNKYNETYILNVIDESLKKINQDGSLMIYTILPNNKKNKLFCKMESLYPYFSSFTNNRFVDIENKIQILFDKSFTTVFNQFYNYGTKGLKNAFEQTLYDTWDVLNSHIKFLINQIGVMTGGSKEQLYQWGRHLTNENKLPQMTIDEIPKFAYNERVRDYQPRCHWMEMKMLIGTIQFLNTVTSDKTINPNKTVVLYFGDIGENLNKVYDMYPEYSWMFYKPWVNILSKLALSHKNPSKITITDKKELITRESLKTKYSDIIIINNVYATEHDIMNLTDMKNAAENIVSVGAKYALIKFHTPTESENYDKHIKLPTSANDYSIPKSKMILPSDKVSKTEFLFFDGNLHLQVFPAMHSTELRLTVKQNKDGTYPFKIYDYDELEGKMYFYNNVVRLNYRITPDLASEHDIPLEELLSIKGIDDGYESYMIYKIINDYKTITKTKDSTPSIISKLMADMEKITKRDSTKCVINTYENLLDFKNLTSEEQHRIRLWLQITKHLHSKSKDLLELTSIGTLIPFHPVRKSSSRRTKSRKQSSRKRKSRRQPLPQT